MHTGTASIKGRRTLQAHRNGAGATQAAAASKQDSGERSGSDGAGYLLLQEWRTKQLLFQQGLICTLLISKDYHLVRVKRDKITSNLLHKMFNDRRRLYRDKMRKALQVQP